MILHVATIPMTRELVDDAIDFAALWSEGRRLTPAEWELGRTARVRANILANLPAGRPAGAWRTA